MIKIEKYGRGEEMAEIADKRNKNGTFAPGNAGGGRKPIPPEIKEALAALIPKAIERLTGIIHDSEDDKLVMEAVKVVFDRVYGKPQQALDIESNNNHTIDVVMTGQLKEWAK